MAVGYVIWNALDTLCERTANSETVVHIICESVMWTHPFGRGPARAVTRSGPGPYFHLNPSRPGFSTIA